MLRRFAKPILALLFILLVVEIVIIAPRDVDVGDAQDLNRVNSTADEKQIEQVMSDAHLFGTRNEVKEWELQAAKATGYKNKPLMVLETVQSIFFTKDGVKFTVTGETGEIDTKTEDLVIRGNVTTRTSNGYLFKTAEITYSSMDKLLKTTSEIDLTGPADEAGRNLKVRGDRLQADLNTSMMDIEGNVRSERGVKDGKLAVIRSQKAQLSAKNNYARFLDNVVIDMDTMRIKGPEAEFVYDAKGTQVKSMAVKGGVSVTDLNKWATSRQVDVHFQEDRYVFTGSPRVVQDNDELKGERIIFLQGGKKVQVQRARANVEKERVKTVN